MTIICARCNTDLESIGVTKGTVKMHCPTCDARLNELERLSEIIEKAVLRGK